MMPAPLPDDPRSGPPANYVSDDERISRALPTRPYSDLTTSMETAYQDAVNGIHLPPSKRFVQGKSFALGGIFWMDAKFPDDEKLQEELEKLDEELESIAPPHPTYSAGITQGMRVIDVKTPRSDTSSDSPPNEIAPGLFSRMEERDYAEVLGQVLRIVHKVAWKLEKYGLFHSKMEELAIEEDDEEDQDEEEETINGGI